MPVNGYVVIVDSYLPTNLGRGSLSREFRNAGYECVRVQSSPEVPILLRSSVSLDGYADNIVHEGDLDKTIDAVSGYQPVAVVAGSEVGVEFADVLSEALRLPTNGTALSPARRDKYLMVETLKAAGVHGARQLLITDADELVAWHRQLGGRIVVKPIRGALGAGVFFCDTAEAAVDAYRTLLDSGNVYTGHEEAVVAQEYHFGPEYMINTVSRDGRHHVCDIWRTSRISANGVLDLCDAVHLLPGDGPVQEQLVGYSFQALDALGIQHGPAHLEVKLTPAGPALIEVGARIAGGDISHNAKLGTGESQVEWTVDAYVRPDRFLDRYQEPYRLRHSFACVAMISPFEGTLRGYRKLDALEKLESCYEVRMLVRPGEQIVRTVDDLTYPLLVNLRHDVDEVVVRDSGTIRYLDGDSFYDVT